MRNGGYFLVSAHREENVDDPRNFSDFLASLAAIHKHWKLPIVVSTHPRTRDRLRETGARLGPGIRFLKPQGFLDYVKLQMNARCVVSDSGTITEESSILGFPAITIRQAHERPEGMDEGTLIMCGLKSESVISAIETVLKQSKGGKRKFRIVEDYMADNVSQKIVRIILSYTDYVNRNVWRKSS